PVVRTDDLLDGWSDQFTFWPRLDDWVLAPLRAGRPGRYRRYSWLRGEFTPAWVPVPAGAVVLLEGVSAARAAIRPELTLAVFVTAPERLRLDRALARDGDHLLPHLRRWRRGEDVHFAADRTAEHADLVVDGAPELNHDPTTRYVRAGGSDGPFT
ncbi:uridine kinase, partial [Micromonospora zhanjiangensis]